MIGTRGSRECNRHSNGPTKRGLLAALQISRSISRIRISEARQPASFAAAGCTCGTAGAFNSNPVGVAEPVVVATKRMILPPSRKAKKPRQLQGTAVRFPRDSTGVTGTFFPKRKKGNTPVEIHGNWPAARDLMAGPGMRGGKVAN